MKMLALMGGQMEQIIFLSSNKLIMPRKNLTLYVVFHNFHKFSYSHGDVDGIIGNPDAPFVYPEG